MSADRLLLALTSAALLSVTGGAIAQPAQPVQAPQASATSQKVDLGKREFESKCAVCHGKDGKGSGPYADQLRQRLPDLTTMAARNGGVFPVNKTFETIEGAGKGHGTRDMPVWGLDFTIQATETYPDLPYNQAVYVRSRIMALIEYLANIQSK